MWFTKRIFAICSELKQWGLKPRFDAGDIVARGFADLGHEEFQVLPGSKLLSLTAGTVSGLQDDTAMHFFWIPSVDESTELLERAGVKCLSMTREDMREWCVEAQYGDTSEAHRASSLHEAMLHALCAVYKHKYQEAPQ
jgi:hypothetical protein